MAAVSDGFSMAACCFRILDGIMSFGERLSASLIAAIFSGSGIPAKYLDMVQHPAGGGWHSLRLFHKLPDTAAKQALTA